MRILLVEDDRRTVKYLTQGLSEEGYDVVSAADGKTGLTQALNGNFDVILLDINLPGMDGISLCRQFRQRGCVALVLMLTARDSVDNRVDGLDAGADDYLIKPYSFFELLARLRALDRRRKTMSIVIQHAGLRLDLATRRVTHKNESLELSGKEYRLLKLFLTRPTHIVSMTTILDVAWGIDYLPETNIVEVYINRLRRKLEMITGQRWIVTHRGMGYSLV